MRLKVFLAFGCLATTLALPVTLRADSCQTAGNVIQNCSFGTGDLTDWTVFSHAGVGNGGVGRTSPKFVTSIGGGYGGDNAELFEGGVVAIYQVWDFNPAQTYTVTFWLSDNAGGSSYFNVMWDSDVIMTLNTSSTLTEYSYTVPNYGEPEQELQFIANNVTQGSYNLSDISVYPVSDDQGTATPEPTSLLLFGSGLAGLAGMIKRKLMA